MKEKGKRLLLAVVTAGILIFLAFAMNNTYQAYTQMIIRQQQQHLLLVSRAVSQNLELCISEQLKQVSILTQTPGFLDAMEEHYQTGETEKIKEYIFSYMLSDQQGPSRMYLLNNKGEQIFHYNQYPFLEEFDEKILNLEKCGTEGISGIGGVFPISENHYGMELVNSVYGGSGYLGTVVSVIDMNSLYDRYVSPLMVNGPGYIMVKDEQGTVIMHPVDGMLGFNEREDIPEFDILPQYGSQKAMLDVQYRQEEGMTIYDSFFNGIIPPDKVIAAFSRMNLWGTSWHISAVMPYSQAVAIEFSNMRRFSLLFGAVLLTVIASGLAIYTLLRKRQKLELETGYLKEINGTLEELHRSREEVRHYQKLTTMGTLAGGIAHEFNNLLTPILGYSEFLREQMGRDSEYYEDIDEIHKAGTRAKEIVEQILPFSRKETDTSGYKTINLDVVIRDASRMVSLIIPSNIRMEEHLDDRNANIYGNATQIHQILLNLYSNAIQSMEETGGTLTVSTRRVNREGMPENLRELAGSDYVELLVADTGCGMEETVLSQIFNPFFTTKGYGDGTGLGLAVVKDILVNHGGFIRVESEPGTGSRFFLYLPATRGTTAIQAAVEEARRENRKEVSVLLVDDEERVVKYFKKRLTKRGYCVDGYTDPEEALKALEEQPCRFHVAIVDYMMPQLKGTVLAQRIRMNQPGMGIIMITGLVESAALHMYQKGVVDKILVKPVSFEELSDEIARLAFRQEGKEEL